MSAHTRAGAAFLARLFSLAAVFGITAYGASIAFGGADRPAEAEEVVAVTADLKDGAELYMTRCMSCHQQNGRGVPGVFPPLAGAEWVTGDKGRLIRIVLGGLMGEVNVEGEVYSGAMPPWGSFLDDKQTADLLTYIRTSWGNQASAVTPEEVTKVRAAVKERREPWTAAELLQEANSGVPGEKAGTK